MSIEIVAIEEKHVDGFRAALDVVARERAYLAAFEAPPIERVQAFVRDNIANGYPQLVALDAGRVVGWCDVTPRDQPTHRHSGTLGMGLLPDWRGRGLGERLILSALERSRDFGFTRVELTVHASNTRAARLYRKVGFEVEGVKRRYVLIDGRYDDAIMMAMLF